MTHSDIFPKSSFKIVFSIWHPTLSLTTISDALWPCEKGWSVGEQLSRGRVRTKSVWIRERPVVGRRRFFEATHEFLEGLIPLKVQIAALRARGCEMDLRIDLHGPVNIGDVLDAETMRLAIDLGLDIGLEYFPSHQNWYVWQQNPESLDLALVVFSGSRSSIACLADALDRFARVKTLGFACRQPDTWARERVADVGGRNPGAGPQRLRLTRDVTDRAAMTGMVADIEEMQGAISLALLNAGRNFGDPPGDLVLSPFHARACHPAGILLSRRGTAGSSSTAPAAYRRADAPCTSCDDR